MTGADRFLEDGVAVNCGTAKRIQNAECRIDNGNDE
jgi:hypothetical protein